MLNCCTYSLQWCTTFKLPLADHVHELDGNGTKELLLLAKGCNVLVLQLPFHTCKIGSKHEAFLIHDRDRKAEVLYFFVLHHFPPCALVQGGCDCFVIFCMSTMYTQTLITLIIKYFYSTYTGHFTLVAILPWTKPSEGILWWNAPALKRNKLYRVQ